MDCCRRELIPTVGIFIDEALAYLIENSFVPVMYSTAANSWRSPEITMTFGTNSNKSKNARLSLTAPTQVSTWPLKPPQRAETGTEEMTTLNTAVEFTFK